jgi:endonuclease YncB( thermonuclease family)
MVAWCVMVLVASPVALARSSQHHGGILAATGEARVIDGDTLVVGGAKVRLEGIDAPEIGQTCGRSSLGEWGCGAAATTALERLVEGQSVACDSRGTDRYGRMLGVCWAGRIELNDEMVRRGHAWAFVRYSQSYVEAEGEARALKLGVWQGASEPAWVYREKRWLAEAQVAPGGCAIKGKITRNGQIYHTPWSPWYGRSRIEERRGERWFCSEGEAIAAGFRPAGAPH